MRGFRQISSFLMEEDESGVRGPFCCCSRRGLGGLMCGYGRDLQELVSVIENDRQLLNRYEIWRGMGSF